MSKFWFDTRFDAEAPPVVDAPDRDVPPPPPPPLTEADLAAAREEGFAAGREEGLGDATAAAQSRLAEALSALAGRIGALGPDYQAVLADCRTDAISIARAIVRKTVAASEHLTAIAAVEQMILSFLPRLLDEPRIVVRVNDALLDSLGEHVQTLADSCGYNGGIVLLSEPGLALPDCRIEWADGGAERNNATLWRDIDDAIESFMAGTRRRAGAAHPPAPPEPENGTDQINPEEKPDG